MKRTPWIYIFFLSLSFFLAFSLSFFLSFFLLSFCLSLFLPHFLSFFLFPEQPPSYHLLVELKYRWVACWMFSTAILSVTTAKRARLHTKISFLTGPYWESAHPNGISYADRFRYVTHRHRGDRRIESPWRGGWRCPL